jgi:hypothetical protein
MYLAIVIVTIIVFLIAVYLAIRKKEPEATNDFSKKEKSFPVQEMTQEPKVKEPELILGQNQTNSQEQVEKENQSESNPEPPSEPEVL